jgi:hypothetical protein
VLTLKLVRLIEKHSKELVGGLTEQVQLSERTADFRKIFGRRTGTGSGRGLSQLRRMVAAKTR